MGLHFTARTADCNTRWFALNRRLDMIGRWNAWSAAARSRAALGNTLSSTFGLVSARASDPVRRQPALRVRIDAVQRWLSNQPEPLMCHGERLRRDYGLAKKDF
jgi:hypothetical protein